ncbi:MAG: hypothetical protein Q9180_009826, partial [Flavoplaca navasiana]
LSFPYQDESGTNGTLYAFTQVFPTVSAICLPHLTSLNLDALSFSYRELVGLLFLSLPKLARIYLTNIRLYKGKWQDIVEGLHCLKKIQDCGLSESPLYDNNNYYQFAHEDFGVRSAEQGDFLYENDLYVMRELSRHPKLKEGKPDSTSAKYLARLNKTLEEVRADQA